MRKKNNNKKYFITNPRKADSRVQIASFMVGSLFVIFALIWTLDPGSFNKVMLYQLALAVPFLFVSSLAYSKVAYREEIELWNNLAWHTNTAGNALVLNSIGLLIAREYVGIAISYFLLTIFLMSIYSAINLYKNPDQIWEKMYKFGFFVVILVVLGIVPSVNGWY